MRSLFEEQMRGWGRPAGREPSPEFSAPLAYQLSPDQYLRKLQELKSALSIPVIASLNGYRAGRWAEFAPRLERMGADAIELNFYQVVADPAIERVFNAITLQFGPKVMLAAKLKMTPGISVEDAVARINALEKRIRERFPEIGWCFMEPDVED